MRPRLWQPGELKAEDTDTPVDNLPGDVIPLTLYALARCWGKQHHSQDAIEAIEKVVDIVSTDSRLSFLRQNIFQEAARYFMQIKSFACADDLLTRQLAIVKLKGSKLLLDFVTINWLINRGNLHAANQQYLEAETCYQDALAIIESQLEPRQEQVISLSESWIQLYQAREQTPPSLS